MSLEGFSGDLPAGEVIEPSSGDSSSQLKYWDEKIKNQGRGMGTKRGETANRREVMDDIEDRAA